MAQTAKQINRAIIEGTPPWLPEKFRRRPEDVRIRFRVSGAERKVYRKRKRIAPSEWVEKHRNITMGALPGKWKNRVTPYLPGIMDASFFPTVRTIIMCAAPQVGKSEAVNNCIGYAIDRDPGPALFVYPDELTARENSNDRIQPMLESSPRLRSYYSSQREDLASLRINLQHMPIYMAWARSAARLANKPIRYVVFDEIDKYPDTANKRETDPILLGEKRTTTFRWNKKIWKMSTPTVEKGPIWVALTEEAQVIFDYHACCPDCGHSRLMTFDGIKWPEGERDPERIERDCLAWYQCPECGSRWTDHKRDAAVRWGQWVSREGGLELSACLEKHRPTKIGFHLPSWISHFVSLSTVAAAFLKAKGDKNKLKDFKNSHEAVPWVPYTKARKEDRILALRDDRPRGIVPSGGRVAALTAAVDTQDNGFWYEIRAWGWGLEQESWQIREGFVESFEAVKRVLWLDEYQDVDGRKYFVRFTVQDAMGHRTREVYDFCRMHRGAVIPYQGKKTLTQPFRYSLIEFYPGTREIIPDGVTLLQVDSNYFKNSLAGKLEIEPADPGAWHFHAETTQEWARHMVAEYLDENGFWQCPEGKANHGWDCSAMNLVAADVLGIKFWKKPEEKKRKKADPPAIDGTTSARRPPVSGRGYKRPNWLNR